jgi:hypothetical protein
MTVTFVGYEIMLRSAMQIYEVIWKEQFALKIQSKHRITLEEVEEILFTKSIFRKAAKGRVRGEDLFAAYGQTESGKYLIIFFIYKFNKAALPITARQMTLSERRYYEKRKKAH